MGCSNSKATKVAEPSAKESSPPKEKPATANHSSNDDNEQARRNSEAILALTETQKEAEKTQTSVEDEIMDLHQSVVGNRMLLGYWGIKGRAYPIRLLLTYKQVDFEDRCYYKDTAPVWFGKDKPEIGKRAGNFEQLNFPSIPFLVDTSDEKQAMLPMASEKQRNGPTIIFQSMAVQRYLGRKYDMCGKSDQEVALEDMFEGVFKDIGDAMQKAVFGGEEEMQKWKAAFDGVWAPIDAHLKEHKFICGDNLVALDFVLFSHMEMVETYNPECFGKYENCVRFRNCLLEDENLKKYVESRKMQPFFPN